MTAELLSLVPFEVAEPVGLDEHRQALARRAAWRLEDAPAEVIIQWAARTFGSRLAMTSSMSDAVLIDLFARHAPGTDVVFLDTGYHFTETIGMRDAVAATYRGRLNIITAEPEQTVAEQDATEGRDLFASNPDRCCALRKVEPLARALEPYTAWASGVRRDESATRADTRAVEWDPRRGMVKVNPMAYWTEADVEAYIAENNILVNPLVYDGYPSIGCAPCTRRVAPGEDTRAGRWSGTGKTECGLHA
jgi:phosphoadenosine phosphosulfate reductase